MNINLSNLPTAFAESLIEALSDPACIEAFFKAHQQALRTQFPDAPQFQIDWHATRLTLLGDSHEVTISDTACTEEPDEWTITCTPDYGS